MQGADGFAGQQTRAFTRLKSSRLRCSVMGGTRHLRRGWVGVRFVVQPSGRVTGCSVTRPSGDADLDGTTCRMIERRFRYRPARDASGNPIAETVTTAFEWTPTGR